MIWRFAALGMIVALAVGGCGDGKLVVALGQPAAVTAAASTGLDPEPLNPGWEPGESYVVRFQDFESVTVRFGDAVVLETGPASTNYSVAGDGDVYRVTINIEERFSSERRDALVERTYAQLLAHGWQYWRGNAPDVVGKITPERWRRCIEGHNDARLKSDDLPNPGDGRIFAATFELTTAGRTASVSTIFGCRLGDDDEAYITEQLVLSIIEHD